MLSASRPSTTFALMGTLRFLGASTIYAVCAFILMTVALFAACVFITYSIVLPALGILDDWFWKPFVVDWLLWQNGSPGIVTTFLILIIAIYTFIYVSFRASSRVVEIKNRVFYANFELFCIIFYLFVGLLSTLLRLAVGLILGLGVISRVDKVRLTLLFLSLTDVLQSLAPRGLEIIDPGYSSYISFLMIDNYYGNPVVLSFAHLLTCDRCDVVS